MFLYGEKKINESQLVVGKTLIMEVNIESREFSGRWYTEIKAWKIDVADQINTIPEIGKEKPPPSLNETSKDDLPF